jgi:hypothetical protein
MEAIATSPGASANGIGLKAMHWRWGLCVVAAIFVAPACSLTTSLDGLRGGADGALDAGGATGEAGGARFCSRVPSSVTFCADFDDGKLPTGLTADVYGGATLNVDTDAVSPPGAAVFTTPVGPGLARAGASLKLLLPTKSMDVVIEFDLRVDAFGSPSFDLLTITNDSGQGGFQIEGDHSLTWDQDTDKVKDLLTPVGTVLTSAWTHVRASVHTTAAAATAQLSLNGAVVGTHTFAPPPVGSAPTFELGDDRFGPGGTNPWRVRIDNLTVDAH